MKIRKFEATTLRQAMDLAKLELGEDAVILNTREIRDAAIGGITRFELVAAMDDRPGQRNSEIEPAPSGVALTADNTQDLAAEVAALRSALESLVGDGVLAAYTRPAPGPERRLRDAGVEPGLASQISRAIREASSKEELAEQWSCLFSCNPPEFGEDNCAIIAITGPSGSGKTTTLAKMAAWLKYSRGLDVAVISCDGQRIGAQDQLGRICEAIGLEHRCCLTGAEVSAALDELSETNAVLIDTPGASTGNRQSILELVSLLADERITKYLILPASMAHDVRCEVYRAFSALEPHRLVITKLDETPSRASVLSISQAFPISLAFLTEGPDIPGGIEPADAGQLAKSVLENLAQY